MRRKTQREYKYLGNQLVFADLTPLSEVYKESLLLKKSLPKW